MTPDEKFQEFLDGIKKIDAKVIEKYTDIYMQCKNSAKRLEAFKDKIKTQMLAQHIVTASPSDSPFMLELTMANTTSVNREGIVNDLAYRLFGKDYEKNKTYKSIVRSNTEHGTQTKLQEPKPNPSYKK